jgi:hypothetical protein
MEPEYEYYPVYYRPFQRDDGSITVCCLQSFDECDYDQSKFLTDIKFDSEDDAYVWIEMREVSEANTRYYQQIKDLLQTLSTIIDLCFSATGIAPAISSSYRAVCVRCHIREENKAIELLKNNTCVKSVKRDTFGYWIVLEPF